MKNNKFLKNAGVLLIAAIFVLTSMATVTTATKMNSSNILLKEYFNYPWPSTWTTDHWNLSYTNVAEGERPEARVYKYDQYYEGQYWDNYIMSPEVNASKCEKIILEFKFAADIFQHCYFNVSYRYDSASPWVVVTPWSNPITQYFVGSYTIIINGNPYCGNALQVKWEYDGYWYNYHHFYLDNVTIMCCDSANRPPSAPTITGQTSVGAGTSYNYNFISTDPDGDMISYYIDWGNMAPSWTTPFIPEGPPGYDELHSWSYGFYWIQAKAKDSCGAESTGTTKFIFVWRNKAIDVDSLFQRVLHNNPNLFPLLRYLLRFQ
jgi:hypothetical protein